MIQFSHVTKVYGGSFEALSDVSVFIDKGEFVFLTGASGAGKTTLLKHIYMEEFPTKGQVFVGGYDSTYMRSRDIPLLRRKLGIVFQDFRLLSDRNVFENVAFAMRVTGRKEREVKRKVFEVLRAYGPVPQVLVRSDAAFRGRAAAGVHCARDRRTIRGSFLPTSPRATLTWAFPRRIMLLFQKINSWGTTVIMATHDEFLKRQYHYRELVLDRGVLIRGGDMTVRPKIGRMFA